MSILGERVGFVTTPAWMRVKRLEREKIHSRIWRALQPAETEAQSAGFCRDQPCHPKSAIFFDEFRRAATKAPARVLEANLVSGEFLII